ncbi:hypothetical protein [Actinoplanes sp. NPDC023714]|uniref:hypothetical protein n=1 Tax=Actinoplanes sp. NPDC023714 TaxID=3154322 RepID=UPI0033C9C730
MTRTPKLLILGTALALAVTGCAQPAPPPDQAVAATGPETADFETADFETVALEAAGFATDVPPSASPAGKQPRPRAIRKLLRKNTLHGEVVVQGKEGERTIVVQRGEVTAAGDDGFTVRSTDGFEQKWSYGDPVRIVRDRKKAERDAVTDGAKVAVGGVRDGESVAARLVVLQ